MALGQTVLWDEPMKAGVVRYARELGDERGFVAGIHDTDYFAKLPSLKTQGGYKSLPHNDGSTRGLWSAAAEFSRLFGSETVVSRERLMAHGVRLDRLARGRPRLVDEATEAWGWRGIVSLADDPPIAGEIRLGPLFDELHRTFDWAVDGTLECISEPDRPLADKQAEKLREIFCRGAELPPETSLADYYKTIHPEIFASLGDQSEATFTKTSELLRFNTKTWDQPRFALAALFVNPDSKVAASRAYDEAIQGSEMYQLPRFGTGAIPFDLVIPGVGRGTLRIGNRGIVIMSRKPQFISLKKPVQSLEELAAVIEAKFGANCVLIGKAVTLIGMLATEFIFMFHEGASGYVSYTRKFHQGLRRIGFTQPFHPILRIRYHTWDALESACVFLSLPEVFQRAFGAEEICAPSFAARWREVVEDQKSRLSRLAQSRRPMDLVRYLSESISGSWACLSREYEGLHGALADLDKKITELKGRRHACYAKRRSLRMARQQAEVAKGQHFREKIFEKSPSAEDLGERERLTQEVEQAIHAIGENEHQIRVLLREQFEAVSAPQVRAIHDRRRAIEMEAELKRLKLVREAIIVSEGLPRAALRPSAWWFPLVSDDGRWHRTTIETAEYYLEPLE